MPTLAEVYCQCYGVSAKRYARSMFWRCLHRRAWPFVPLFRLFSRDYFSADEELIRDVGRLTVASGLTEDLANFHTHPGNIGFLRRRLKLRLSIGRVTRMVHRLLPGRAPTTFYEATKPLDEEASGTVPRPESPPHSASS